MTNKAKMAIIIAVIVVLLGAIAFGACYSIKVYKSNKVEQQIQDYRVEKRIRWERENRIHP